MRIAYLSAFVEEYDRLDRPTRNRIRRKLDDLSRMDPRALPHQPLKGLRFKGLYKYRVGDWRLIYQIRCEEICFVTLGHRSDVYR